MPAAAKPKVTHNKDGSLRKRGSRVALEVSRDAIINVRTYQEVRERLDALVILRNRPSRASLIEYYLMRAIEQDERELGILDAAEGDVMPEPLPSFQGLAPQKKERVLAIYKRAGRLAKAREGAALKG